MITVDESGWPGVTKLHVKFDSDEHAVFFFRPSDAPAEVVEKADGLGRQVAMLVKRRFLDV